MLNPKEPTRTTNSRSIQHIALPFEGVMAGVLSVKALGKPKPAKKAG